MSNDKYSYKSSGRHSHKSRPCLNMLCRLRGARAIALLLLSFISFG